MKTITLLRPIPLSDPRSGVFHRGNPDDRAPLVHLCIPATGDGCHKEKPLCGNGNYHIRMTGNYTRVTCPACLEAMS
jgi:hypothetical protein